MKNILYFIILFSALGCTKKETPQEELKPYVISEKEREIREGEIPLPPKGYYGEFQLLIDERDNFYCYQREDQSYVWNCVIDENDTLPEFLNIQPKDLLHLNSKNITGIINENVMTKPKKRQILIIASQKDTIQNTSLINYLRTTKIPIYIIRRTTQEEDTVLHYKKEDKHYFSDDIKWNKNRIKFRKDK